MNKIETASVYGKTVTEGFKMDRKRIMTKKMESMCELSSKESVIKALLPEVLMDAHETARLFQHEYLRYIISICKHLMDSESSNFVVADELQMYADDIEDIITISLRNMRTQVVDEVPSSGFIKIIGG